MTEQKHIHVNLVYKRKPTLRVKRHQPWRFFVKSGDNWKTLAISSERYTNKQDALDAIELLFGPDTVVSLRESKIPDNGLRDFVRRIR